MSADDIAGTPPRTDADLRSASRRLVDDRPTRVRDGLWSIPVRIPVSALKVVNVYAFELPGGELALLDTGWDTEESWVSLVDGLRVLGRAPQDVAAVVVSHAHPDHLGLAHRIHRLRGAPVYLHEREAARLTARPSMPDRYRSAVRRHFPDWGVPSSALTDMLTASEPSSHQAFQVPVTAVADGDRLPFPGWDLRVVWTPGHTPGHLCLHEPDRRLLFTGDHVLQRITPGVGAHPGESEDALGHYLDSLERVGRLTVDEVMPGHEARFAGLTERAHSIIEHHHRRLDEVADLVTARPGCPAWSVTRRLTWSRPLDQFGGPMIRGAVTETVAHLQHLQRLGRLRSIPAEKGTDVTRWYPC